MDRDLKARWIAALRSGDYKQGHGTLYDSFNDAFCCLGVLDIVREPGKDKNNLSYPTWDMTNDQLEACWERNDGCYDHIRAKQFHKHSFAEIADWLESRDDI